MEVYHENYEDRMLGLNDVFMVLEDALNNQKPLSLGRYGHGEIAHLGWIHIPEWTKLFEPHSSYAGATASMAVIQKELDEAIRATDLVGLHASWGQASEDRKTAEMTKRLFHQLDFSPKHICSAFITHDMINSERFWELIKDRKVALVGRRATEAVPYFKNKGINVTYTSVLEGMEQIAEAHHDLASRDWEIALVAAGIPATILAPRLAKQTNRVVIDFGHALDKFIDGENFNYQKILDDWKAETAENFKVSMVMAVHNGEKFLSETLDYALVQTYPNLEIIIVNDGSSDGTKQMLDEISDERVRVVHLEENQGAAHALNTGISEAKGEWIAIQDADDHSYPERIAEQVKYIQDHPQLVGVGSFVKCISGDPDIPDSVYGGLTQSRNTHNSRDEIRKIIFWGCPFTHSSMMFNKKVFWEAGGYDTRFKIAYDYDLWLKLLERGELEKINKVLLDYRIHKGSLSHKNGQMTVDEIQLASARAIFRKFQREGQEQPKVIVIGPAASCRNFQEVIEPLSGLKIERMIYKKTWRKKIPFAIDNLRNGVADAIIVLENRKKNLMVAKLTKRGLKLNKHFFVLYNILK